MPVSSHFGEYRVSHPSSALCHPSAKPRHTIRIQTAKGLSPQLIVNLLISRSFPLTRGDQDQITNPLRISGAHPALAEPLFLGDLGNGHEGT